jgi:hypothetical protein
MKKNSFYVKENKYNNYKKLKFILLVHDLAQIQSN